MRALRSVSWSSVVSLGLMIAAIVSVIMEVPDMGVVLALCAIAWALLSLREEPI